jgi:hypothetical protein
MHMATLQILFQLAHTYPTTAWMSVGVTTLYVLAANYHSKMTRDADARILQLREERVDAYGRVHRCTQVAHVR